MQHNQQSVAAAEFARKWAGRGYEKGESQPFWMELIQTVLGVERPYDIISFENQVKLSSTSFIDAYIEQTAQAILDARAKYPDCSLADLYDEITMPPELRKAHQDNDKAVMDAYGFNWRTMTESDCVAELFKMYQKLNASNPIHMSR